jgi:hypothetical protein
MAGSMLVLPSRDGWCVEYESDDVSKRTGKKIWREVLCTTNKEKAEAKLSELEKEGKNARMLQCIF